MIILIVTLLETETFLRVSVNWGPGAVKSCLSLELRLLSSITPTVAALSDRTATVQLREPVTRNEIVSLTRYRNLQSLEAIRWGTSVPGVHGTACQSLIYIAFSSIINRTMNSLGRFRTNEICQIRLCIESISALHRLIFVFALGHESLRFLLSYIV